MTNSRHCKVIEWTQTPTESVFRLISSFAVGKVVAKAEETGALLRPCSHRFNAHLSLQTGVSSKFFRTPRGFQSIRLQFDTPPMIQPRMVGQ